MFNIEVYTIFIAEFTNLINIYYIKKAHLY